MKVIHVVPRLSVRRAGPRFHSAPLVAATLCLLIGFSRGSNAATPPQAPSPGDLCRAAVISAEREMRVPTELLSAIARVESGRIDPASGRVVSWPWTINAEGEGRFFASKAEAVAAVQDLMARGVRVIDVGCMQVNLFHHSEAFDSIEEAFDPTSNARYAARFLKRLYTASGDWFAAAVRYHSSAVERAQIYRARILASWPAGRAAGITMEVAAAALSVDPAIERREKLVEAWASAKSNTALSSGSVPEATASRSVANQQDMVAEAWSRMRAVPSAAPAMRLYAPAP